MDQVLERPLKPDFRGRQVQHLLFLASWAHHIIMPKIWPNMSKRHVQLATHTLICLIRHYYQALLTILILIGCNLFGAIFKNYSLITRERKHLVILKNDVTNHWSEIRINIARPISRQDFLLFYLEGNYWLEGILKLKKKH